MEVNERTRLKMNGLKVFQSISLSVSMPVELLILKRKHNLKFDNIVRKKKLLRHIREVKQKQI